VKPARIVYCHCAYSQVVPADVKQQVLRQLAESETAFDAVADLCEMSARRDPGLKALAAGGDVKIAACFPRAVRGLFIAADAPLPESGVEICNMRTDTAEQVMTALLTVGGRAIDPIATAPAAVPLNGEKVLEEKI
jgi:hypothetical protein